MKKIFSLFAAILFAGSMMAGEAQHLKVTLAGNGTYDNTDATSPTITWLAANDQLTVVQKKGTAKATTAYPQSSYVSATGMRVYKGNILSFEAAAGYVIDTVIITTSGKYTGNPITAGTELTGDTIITSNTTDLDARFNYSSGSKDTIINKTGVSLFYIQNARTAAEQIRITNVDIRYTKEASSTPAITVGNVDFGTFVPNVSNPVKEVEVVGENLTEPITYALMMGSQFDVTGTLTSTGGTLSVELTDLIGGDPMDVIQFSVGGSLMKEVNVSAHVVETTGKGTKAEPFTCPDVANLNNTFAGNYWVEGYILGGYSGSGKVTQDDKNAGLLIAIAMDSPIDTISVQLPNNAIRTALNVPDNSSTGWKIKVYGSLEKYGNFAGVKTPTDYEIISTPTAIDETEAAGKATKELREGQVLIIKGNKTYNILGQEIK